MTEVKVEESLRKQGEKLLASKVNLDMLLPIIGDGIEREALRRFKHNEEWAIRGVLHDAEQEADPSAWEQIKEKFRQEIAQELTPEQLVEFPTEEILDGLPSLIEDYIIAIVRGYQRETFDPLTSFRKRLEVQQRAPGTVNEYFRLAARFVGRYGRKRSYTDTEIMDFLYDEQKRVGPNTYCSRVAALKVFIQSIEKGRPFPIDVPIFKGETHSPTLSKEQVDALILAGCIFLQPVELLRLAATTIYGARVGEVAALSCRHIDLPNKSITIPVEKKELMRPQPIPEFMLGVFSAPITPRDKKVLQKDLKRWCRLAGFTLPAGVGFHSIRNALGTELHNAGVDIYSINVFGRWSIKGLGTGARYIKTPKQVTDAKVLEVHPFAKTWREALELRDDISLRAKRDFCPLTASALCDKLI